MEFKKYIRRGVFEEAENYRTVLKFRESGTSRILMLLEGKCRRKLSLNASRKLYENYYPVSFIGLEDLLLGQSRPGAAGVYPGSHYVVWDGNDFLNAMNIHPELARRAIYDMSRRIRIYDSHQKVTDSEFKRETEIDIGAAQPELTDALYEMSFADEDSFPPHLVEKLSRNFEPGDYLMKQGDSSKELYILLDGQADVFHNEGLDKRKIDTLSHGDMAGEMAQFDGHPRSADVQALTKVTALVFLPENFHMLFQLHPRWSLKLLRTLALRIEQRRIDFETLDLNILSQQSF